MTVTPSGNNDFRGLATDTKPTVAAGTRFYEIDTGDTLISDGTFWWLQGMPSLLSMRRVGYMQSSQSAIVGTGILSNCAAASTAGTQAFAADTVNGRYLNCVSGTVLTNKGGFRVNIGTLFIRTWNPQMRFRFSVPAIGDHTLGRLFMGMQTNAEPTTDDPYNGASAFTVGFVSGGTNFVVLRNNAAGATEVSGDVASSPQVLDESIHTVSIVADHINTRFGIKWDNNDYIFYDTEIPSATAIMSLGMMNETNEALAKTFRLYSLFVQSDK